MTRTQILAAALRRIAADADMVETSSIAEQIGVPVDDPDVDAIADAVGRVARALRSRANRLDPH